MIDLLLVSDEVSLRARACRDAVTLAQLQRRGVPGARLERRCGGCGSEQHGAIRVSGRPEVGISRSSSRGYHLFAVSPSQPALGVDIEHVDRSGQALRAAPRLLGPGDPAVARDRTAALRTFVRKEAILKARGTGFHFDARRQPTVSRASSADWSVTEDGWFLHERWIEDLVLCIAVSTPQPVGPLSALALTVGD